MTLATQEGLIPRRNVLTEADLQELAELLAKHPCKFNQVSHEDMDNMKRMSKFFLKVEDKIVAGIQWVFIAIVGGFFWILYNHGYFTK